MKALALVSIGGTAGSLTRWSFTLITPDSATGTLLANLTGVAIAAFLLVLMERRGITELRWLLLPGFCGGMTTFSAVTLEVVGEDSEGFGYLVLTILLSLAIVASVIPVARRMIVHRA